MGGSDTSSVDEASCTIYMEITNLAASALAATVCFAISQLLQQATLLPVFAIYFFELFPNSALSRKIIKILSALGAEKDAITSVVKGAVSAHGPADTDHEATPTAPEAHLGGTTVKGHPLPRLDTSELPLGARVPAPRLLNRSATTRTLYKMEQTIKEFKIPLGNFISLDFHGYVVISSFIFCSTSMVTVAFILWDSETIRHWYDGGFDESLSAYNIFLALCTIFGFTTMLIFVKILNEVYTLDNLKAHGFTLESRSKATADALFWVSTLTFTIALCVKWVYIIIILYVIAVLLLEATALVVFAGARSLFFFPLWSKIMVPVLRAQVPWLFVSKDSHRIHSPAYFLVYFIVYLMNFVTQMSRRTIRVIVEKVSLMINLSFLVYTVILFTFVITVGKRDPEVVQVCVSTSTIVVAAGYLGSGLLLLARPLLYLLYGESMLMQFGITPPSEGGDGERYVKRNSGTKKMTDDSLSDASTSAAEVVGGAKVVNFIDINRTTNLHSQSLGSEMTSDDEAYRCDVVELGSMYDTKESTRDTADNVKNEHRAKHHVRTASSVDHHDSL